MEQEFIDAEFWSLVNNGSLDNQFLILMTCKVIQ